MRLSRHICCPPWRDLKYALWLPLYLLLFLAGALTTATQWRRIRTSAWKKVLYTLTFPLFMATYVPITVLALFGKVEWKPIEHRAVMTVRELK